MSQFFCMRRTSPESAPVVVRSSIIFPAIRHKKSNFDGFDDGSSMSDERKKDGGRLRSKQTSARATSRLPAFAVVSTHHPHRSETTQTIIEHSSNKTWANNRCDCKNRRSGARCLADGRAMRSRTIDCLRQNKRELKLPKTLV